jgi:hypothetical protein
VTTVDTRSAVAEPDASAAALRDASPPSGPDASCLAGATRRVCAWCKGPIPARARRDSITCSVRCRQARHRFGRTVGRARSVEAGHPLRLAYADPPYPGRARSLYGDHPDYAGEVDHAALIDQLMTYDGWALSTAADALPAVLALCPPGVRVAAWHKGERVTESWRPLNAWEPVIYWGGRPVEASSGSTRRVDSLVHGVSAMTTLPGRVIGAKPAAFSRWLFDLLGAQPQDSLDDLFPGSGAVGRAWRAFTGQTDPSTEALHDASARAEHDTSHPTSDTTAPSSGPASGPDGSANAGVRVPGQLGLLDWLVDDGLLGADQVVPLDVLLAEDERGCE